MGSGPHGEREKSVTEADLQRYGADVLSLAKRISGAGAEEQVIWEVYASTEKLIAVLKLRLDYETPGLFTKLPDASGPAKLLTDALALLSKSGEEISQGNLVESIETLRSARNNLRSYLTDKRKAATRSKRTPRAKASD